MVFSVEFERSFIFQGFEGVFCGIVVIFGLMEIGETLDFSGVCRSGYRSGVFGWIEVKCLGNTDFTRGLWIEQICRS